MATALCLTKFALDTGAPDGALFPVGAYEPRLFMASQHVDPAEEVQIFEDLNAKYAIGINWGTFQLTDEARDATRQDLGQALLNDEASTWEAS